MELRGTIESLKQELNILRRPLGPESKFEFIPISEKEEQKIIEDMARVFDAHWNNEEELDTALVFMESPVGKKSLDLKGELNEKLHVILSNHLKKLIKKANQQTLASLAQNPGNRTIH